MARLLLFWTRPDHLTADQAEEWVRAEAGRLLELPSVEGLELTHLEAPSERHARPWDWMLELHLSEGTDGSVCADEPQIVEWLSDLRLLGMRPWIVLAQSGTMLTGEVG